jgi:hypothetical protein
MLQFVEQRMRTFPGVAWPSMGGRGCYTSNNTRNDENRDKWKFL